MDWRRESDKEVAQLSEQCACNTTHWLCECQQERMTKLERLAEDARPMVCSSRYVMVADNWLARYDEMFPEVK